LPAGVPSLILNPAKPADPLCHRSLLCHHSGLSRSRRHRRLQRLPNRDALCPRQFASQRESCRRSPRPGYEHQTPRPHRSSRPHRSQPPYHAQSKRSRRNRTGPLRRSPVQQRRDLRRRQWLDRLLKSNKRCRSDQQRRTGLRPVRRRPFDQDLDQPSVALPYPLSVEPGLRDQPSPPGCRRSSSTG
jgi:hypothetical protein